MLRSATIPLHIPIVNQSEDISIFIDEFQDFDFNDLIDILRAQLAPLHVWKAFALEYYRQGRTSECEDMLCDIVEALSTPEIFRAYSSSNSDNIEREADIYDALAALMVRRLSDLKDKEVNKKKVDEISGKIIEYINKSEKLISVNEYIWLIKGFYNLLTGEIKHAEDNFKAVFDRSTKAAKKKYQYGALIGLASVAYHNKNYNVSLDHLCKAVMVNPHCPASIRVGIAVNCFHLRQYTRAKDALSRALSLEPNNADALCLCSLIEFNEVHKTKSIADSSNLSLDYCILASTVDPKHAVALSQIANHLCNNWRIYRKCRFTSENVLAINGVILDDIVKSDLIDISGQEFLVEDVFYSNCTVSKNDTSFDITTATVVLSGTPPSDLHLIDVKVKEFGKVYRLCQNCLKLSTSKSLRSECFYLLGKMYHGQGKIDYAFENYHLSIREDSNMTLAQFEAARILFSRKDFSSALELFNRIHERYPDDRDTLGFIYLIRSLVSGETISYDALRDVNTQFQYNIDLWLIQASNRHKDPHEYTTALKCYNHAVDAIKSNGQLVKPIILANMSVLDACLGKVSTAYEQLVLAFKFMTSSINERPSVTFESNEFLDIFYRWDEAPFSFEGKEESGYFQLIGRTDEVDISTYFQENDVVLVNDIIAKVVAVFRNTISVTSAVLPLIKRFEGSSLILKKKIYLSSRFEENLTMCYNFGRILEELGKTSAAVELFQNILKIHPCFIDCYIRLSLIAANRSRYEESFDWLRKAEIVDCNNADYILTKGDLCMKTARYEDAKKQYEKLLSQKNSKDPKAVLCLGNLYFSGLCPKYQIYVKDSYKYYFNVLQDDKRNLFASIGVGMIFADRGKYESAKEVFTKVREFEKGNVDVLLNLANINCQQNKYIDAENMFNAALRLALKSSQNVSSIYLNLSYVSLKNDRFDDSLKYLHRLVHEYPNDTLAWFNIGVVRLGKGLKVFNKHSTNKKEIADSIVDLRFAVSIFEVLARTGSSINKDISRDTLKANLHTCREKLSKAIEVSRRSKVANNDSPVKESNSETALSPMKRKLSDI